MKRMANEKNNRETYMRLTIFFRYPRFLIRDEEMWYSIMIHLYFVNKKIKQEYFKRTKIFQEKCRCEAKLKASYIDR